MWAILVLRALSRSVRRTDDMRVKKEIEKADRHPGHRVLVEWQARFFAVTR